MQPELLSCVLLLLLQLFSAQLPLLVACSCLLMLSECSTNAVYVQGISQQQTLVATAASRCPQLARRIALNVLTHTKKPG